MTPEEKLADAVIHHSLNLFRYSAAEVTATMKRLKKMEKRLVAELATELTSDSRKSEVNAVLKATDDIIHEYYGGIQQSFDFADIGQTVSSATSKSLQIALGEQAASVPTQAYFKSLASDILIKGSPAKDWWAAQESALQFKFAAQVRQGLANAETNQQIIARIVGTKSTPGIMEVARKDAASLVQTSVQAVANDARMETFKANDDVINGFTIVATLDGHTCELCMAYSGAQYELDGTPIGDAPDLNGGPPWHFNDRCVCVPITKTFKELGLNIDEPGASTRASDEGQISGNTTFDDFLKTKSEAYQDEMLGPGRADLWRNGKITLRDLVNGKGRPLTLDELKAKFS